MTRALIGHSGFIGSNLASQMAFDDFYNSKNIHEIEGKNYELVISAGNSSLRWKVNQEPEIDRRNIENFIKHVARVTAGIFVLISTIDVYKNPIGVDEDVSADVDDSNSYGANRLCLENFIREHFSHRLIIRLPIVYGLNFKKNILYDVLNNHQTDKIDPTASLQFYNVVNLSLNINQALAARLNLLNMATTPIVVADLMSEAFGLKLNNPPGPGLQYDMRTKHAGAFGKTGQYIYERGEIIADLKKFKTDYRHES